MIAPFLAVARFPFPSNRALEKTDICLIRAFFCAIGKNNGCILIAVPLSVQQSLYNRLLDFIAPAYISKSDEEQCEVRLISGTIITVRATW